MDDTAEPSGSSAQYRESDLEFISRHAEKIDAKIESLQTGLKVLEEKLATTGDDAQLANIDLQNVLQKQQQALQMISNVMKSMQDTQMATISRIG
jgi:phage protein D